MFNIDQENVTTWCEMQELTTEQTRAMVNHFSGTPLAGHFGIDEYDKAEATAMHLTHVWNGLEGYTNAEKVILATQPSGSEIVKEIIGGTTLVW